MLVIRDTRESGEMLEAALAAGVTAAGGDVFLGGVLPTPAAPLLIAQYGFDLAAVVSASHNPYARQRHQVLRRRRLQARRRGRGGDRGAAARRLRRRRRAIGRVRALHGTQEDYLRALHARFADLDLTGLDVLLDCAHGATYRVGAGDLPPPRRDASRRSATEPDGRNINDGVGSTHVEALAAAVAAGGHDVGFAFDGDGDRVLAVDGAGQRRRRRRADRARGAAPARAGPPRAAASPSRS